MRAGDHLGWSPTVVDLQAGSALDIFAPEFSGLFRPQDGFEAEAL
jgi:hypothetical protein